MRSSTTVVYSQTLGESAAQCPSVLLSWWALQQCSSQPVPPPCPAADVDDKIPFPCTVPLLPFTVEEVLLPGEHGACQTCCHSVCVHTPLCSVQAQHLTAMPVSKHNCVAPLTP